MAALVESNMELVDDRMCFDPELTCCEIVGAFFNFCCGGVHPKEGHSRSNLIRLVQGVSPHASKRHNLKSSIKPSTCINL
jgi:hypothetical protein